MIMRISSGGKTSYHIINLEPKHQPLMLYPYSYIFMIPSSHLFYYQIALTYSRKAVMLLV